MQNLYKAWQSYLPHLNKLILDQKKLDHLSQRANHLGQMTYPVGEDWKYVDFSSLRALDLQMGAGESKVKADENDETCTIELNDFSRPFDFVATGLPRGLKVLTHSQALQDERLKEKLITSLSQQETSVVGLNQWALPFLGMGLVVEANRLVEKVLKIKINLNNNLKPNSLAPFHLLVDCVAGSSLQIFVEYCGENYSGLCNTRVDARVEESAQLTLASQQRGGTQGFFSSTLFASVQAKGCFNSWDVTMPGGWSRHDTDIQLLAPHAETHLKGVYMGKDHDFSDHHTQVHHKKGETQSFEDYRGLLTDSARAVFNGKVFIEKMAAKSNAEQLNKNLMLSQKAEVDTKPELQIDNDDVKAAHGATVGQINQDQRFYLMSRGYSAQQALSSLCRAFVFDLLEGESPRLVRFYEENLLKALSTIKES